MNIDMTSHSSILGITQSGKTILAREMFYDTGGLYIDIEDKGDIEADITLTRRSSPKRFRDVIKRYKRVKYVPHPDPRKSVKEIKWIWSTLSKLNKNMYVYADEIQNWGDSRRNEFDVFAIRGLKSGLHLVSISQRLAKISKTIVSQSKTIIFFDISTFAKKYFKEYDLPYDRILRMFYEVKENGDLIPIAPKYSFAVYTRGKGLFGPYKLENIKV